VQVSKRTGLVRPNKFQIYLFFFKKKKKIKKKKKKMKNICFFLQIGKKGKGINPHNQIENIRSDMSIFYSSSLFWAL